MEELIKKYDALYEEMAASKNPMRMMAFGDAEKWMFYSLVEKHPDLAEMWLKKLEASKWHNYLTEEEAEEVVEAKCADEQVEQNESVMSEEGKEQEEKVMQEETLENADDNEEMCDEKMADEDSETFADDQQEVDKADDDIDPDDDDAKGSDENAEEFTDEPTGELSEEGVDAMALDVNNYAGAMLEMLRAENDEQRQSARDLGLSDDEKLNVIMEECYSIACELAELRQFKKNAVLSEKLKKEGLPDFFKNDTRLLNAEDGNIDKVIKDIKKDLII